MTNRNQLSFEPDSKVATIERMVHSLKVVCNKPCDRLLKRKAWFNNAFRRRSLSVSDRKSPLKELALPLEASLSLYRHVSDL